MLDQKIVLTLFTTKEAEQCPGNWIAICKNGCGFYTHMSASGVNEAKSIAFNRHPIKCANPKIVVGRVPDE